MSSALESSHGDISVMVTTAFLKLVVEVELGGLVCMYVCIDV